MPYSHTRFRTMNGMTPEKWARLSFIATTSRSMSWPSAGDGPIRVTQKSKASRMMGEKLDRRMIRPAWRTVAKNALRMISHVTAYSPSPGCSLIGSHRST